MTNLGDMESTWLASITLFWLLPFIHLSTTQGSATMGFVVVKLLDSLIGRICRAFEGHCFMLRSYEDTEASFKLSFLFSL